jgi:LDH2 family malate/lactate/ureidoglycolate dehydrogenase
MPDLVPPHRTGLRFDWVINFGALLNCAVILVGVIGWAITSSNNATQNGRDLAAFKSDVAGQLRDLRDGLAKQMDDMRSDVRSLPDQRAHIDGLERWTAQADARMQGLEARMSALEKTVIEIKADLAAVGQASRAKLTK